MARLAKKKKTAKKRKKVQ